MFGFAALSDRAGEIERLVVDGVTGVETLDQVDTLIDQLGVALAATQSKR
jgi:hypothetical protein